MHHFVEKLAIQPGGPRGRSKTVMACCAAFGFVLAGLTGAATLTGCGGGGTSSAASTAVTGTAAARSRATVSITWPSAAVGTNLRAAPRLIPAAAASIVVTFSLNGTVAATQTVTRPATGSTSTLTFDSLPVGTLTAAATAYPNADGTGTAQATASKSVTITAGATTAVAITMASTISMLTLTPAAPTVAVGATATLTATPLDASGATVLSSATISWTSSSASVATVSAAGVVTGVAGGTATITATESESGKSASVMVTVTASTGSSIVDVATAYINSLSSTQQSVTVLASSAANAAKWSNLPATPASDGTNNLRNGVAYSTLSDAQKTAFLNLVQAALSTQGYNQFTQIRYSDYYLGSLRSGYSGDYEYIAFVGTPSATGSWLLQIGGHHIAHNYYYTGTTLQTTTPYFLGVEPQSFVYNGTTYTPLSAQRNGMYNLINSFSTTQLASAKLTSSFSDVLLGPGQDARSNFPTGTTGRGLLASNLTTAQQALLKTAISAWTQNSPLSSTYQSLYESELSQTYVAYAGTTAFTSQGDYVRIDGPHVWIEFVCQNGVVISGQIHFHTIWRDRVSDYNAAYGF